MATRKRDTRGKQFVTKLDEETRSRALEALRHGMPIGLAAQYAGVVESTLLNWLRSGRAAIAQANGNLAEVLESDPFASFTHEAQMSIAEWVLERMLLVEKAGRDGIKGEWQANMTLLERRFPQQFGRRTRHEVTGPGGGPIQHAVVVHIPHGAWEGLSIEERQQLSTLLAKIEGEIVEGEPELLALNP